MVSRILIKKIYFRRVLLSTILNLILCSVIAQTNERASIQAKEMLQKLTIEDCIHLISGSDDMNAPGIPRLGIPDLKMTDGPFGPHTGKAPGFPVGICLAATWDTILINQAASLMGKCTHAQGKNTLLGPCINIHRVPNGGRNFESYGEDPWLTSRMAVAFIKGLRKENVLPMVKHFACNNNDWNRSCTNVDVDERTLREIYLPSFEAAVKEGGALGVMSSYNYIRGLHASEQEYLIRQILKNEWGFKGIVVSDWTSVYSTVGPINAGLDVEMPMPVYFLPDSIRKYLKMGLIMEEILKEKAERLLYVRYASGINESAPIKQGSSILMSSETNKMVRDLAEKGITLLKNENKILPLSGSYLKSIAVIGPNAATLQSGGGGSSYIESFYRVTPLEGIRKLAGKDIEVTYALGDPLVYNRIDPIASTCFLQPDGKTPGLKAEYYNNVSFEGKPTYSCVDTSINFTWFDQQPAPGLDRSKYSVRWSGYLVPPQTGWYTLKYMTLNAGVNGDFTIDYAMVLIDNKAVIDHSHRQDASPGVMQQYFEAGKKYALRVEMAVPHNRGQAILGWIPPVKTNKNANLITEAVDVAAKADVAIVCVGWNSLYETEGYDKEEGISLPCFQEDLITAVAAVNPNTIVIVNSGTPFFCEKWAPKVKGLIMAYYPGHEGGNALANILFGKVNPSGKLPFTCIADSSQTPVYKNYTNVVPTINYAEGLYFGYRYIDKNKMTPQYSFGYGLSYTSFAMSNAKAQVNGSHATVTLSVKNTGDREGEEVVQVYVCPQNPKVDKPVKELKGFAKVFLKSGETKQLSINLSPRAFAYFNVDQMKWLTEAGKYKLIIGNSSQNVQQTVNVNVK